MNSQRWTCSECDDVFTRHYSLVRHQRRFHPFPEIPIEAIEDSEDEERETMDAGDESVPSDRDSMDVPFDNSSTLPAVPHVNDSNKHRLSDDDSANDVATPGSNEFKLDVADFEEDAADQIFALLTDMSAKISELYAAEVERARVHEAPHGEPRLPKDWQSIGCHAVKESSMSLASTAFGYKKFDLEATLRKTPESFQALFKALRMNSTQRIGFTEFRASPKIGAIIGTELKEIGAALRWAADESTPEDAQLRWAMAKDGAFIGVVELDAATPGDAEDMDDDDHLSLDSAASSPLLSPLSAPSAVLKVRINKDFAGFGYSTESVKALLLHLFNENTSNVSRVHSVFSTTYPEKAKAENAMERLGFSITEQVSPSMRRDGTAVEGWTVWEIERDGFMELWAS
ncbi:hypothetical protein HDU98_011227 [Podochytrium sp. JEL0797]|nr:hypothetical protein HDU98_011227 [Podochytrium sp. JEL0797]